MTKFSLYKPCQIFAFDESVTYLLEAVSLCSAGLAMAGFSAGSSGVVIGGSENTRWGFLGGGAEVSVALTGDLASLGLTNWSG